MRNAKMSVLLGLLTLALFMVGPTIARAADQSVSNSDKKFIEDAASGGMMEVKLGDFASKNATDQSVKDFGQKMVTDHTKANDQLTQIAKSKGVDVPSEMNQKDQKMYDKLTKMTGSDFDKAYMKQMVKDHEKDVKEFEKEAKKGEDNDLKQFAVTTVETLKQHLELAKQTADKVGASSGKSADVAAHKEKQSQ